MLDVCHRQLLWQPRDEAEQEGTWGSGPTKGRVGADVSSFSPRIVPPTTIGPRVAIKVHQPP